MIKPDTGRKNGFVGYKLLSVSILETGSEIVKVDPLPRVDVTVIFPPCISTIFFAIDNPRPYFM